MTQQQASDLSQLTDSGASSHEGGVSKVQEASDVVIVTSKELGKGNKEDLSNSEKSSSYNSQHSVPHDLFPRDSNLADSQRHSSGGFSQQAVSSSVSETRNSLCSNSHGETEQNNVLSTSLGERVETTHAIPKVSTAKLASENEMTSKTPNLDYGVSGIKEGIIMGNMSGMGSLMKPSAGISALELLGGEANVRPKVEVKLFVGRLPRSMEESNLTPLFTPFGEVAETVIIRDKSTGMHKGSAFVKMASITEADAAVRALHNIKVIEPQLGPIQVKYANGEAERLALSTDAAQAGNDLGKLFIGSLPKGITEVEVTKIFEAYGRVEEVVLMKDPANNLCKGCAFVKFAYKENAIHAIKSLHGKYTVPGSSRPLEVKFAENRRALSQQQVPQNVIPSPLGNFGVANPVSRYLHHSQNGVQPHQPIPLATNTGAMNAMQFSNVNPRKAGNWTEYFTADGRAYYHNSVSNTTQWSKPPEFDRIVASSCVSGGSDVAGPPGANVFVFHIPNDWTHADLVAAFSPYGNVISCYIATDKPTGRNKGYGFISFDDPKSAADAVWNMNGHVVNGKRLKVSIKTGEESYVAHLLNAHHSFHPPNGGTAPTTSHHPHHPNHHHPPNNAALPPQYCSMVMGGNNNTPGAYGSNLNAYRSAPY